MIGGVLSLGVEESIRAIIDLLEKKQPLNDELNGSNLYNFINLSLFFVEAVANFFPIYIDITHKTIYLHYENARTEFIFQMLQGDLIRSVDLICFEGIAIIRLLEFFL
jgi:hypothetical protein